MAKIMLIFCSMIFLRHDITTYTADIKFKVHSKESGIVRVFDGKTLIEKKRLKYDKEGLPRVTYEFKTDTIIVVYKRNRDTLLNINHYPFVSIYLSKKDITITSSKKYPYQW